MKVSHQSEQKKIEDASVEGNTTAVISAFY